MHESLAPGSCRERTVCRLAGAAMVSTSGFAAHTLPMAAQKHVCRWGFPALCVG